MFRPYVSSEAAPAEFTANAIVPGVLFGIVFGAANAYLGLRAGLTISTSIPIAVMTVAAFKVLAATGRRGTILEANMSQTIGSASSSVASGVIFTIPALFLWNLDPSIAQMTLLAFAGGALGVFFMIPLRSLLIEREHDALRYPEGTACAEVLVASEAGGGRANPVFAGLGIGALFKACAGGVQIFPDTVEAGVPLLRKGQIATEISAALFGVGYILGPRIATVMVGGGALSSLVIIPIFATWGEGRTTPLFPETMLTISEMSANLIWSRYVRYIGAGAVATAGIITLIRSIPTMAESFRLGVRQLRHGAAQRSTASHTQRSPAGTWHRARAVLHPAQRTSWDLPFTATLYGSALVVLLLAVVPYAFGALGPFVNRAVAAICVGVFAFFFVTVSSRIVGLVGVTSNPTSGMTIAALLGTSTVFLALGWTDDAGKMGALTVGAVVAIAASIAGDMSQDLKTGYLLGATPRLQQIGELLGVLTSALFVCLTVVLLDRAYGFGTTELPAPQATLMKLVIEGVLDEMLPWGLVGIGVAIALVAATLRLPVLAFAVGVYLPVATMMPIFLGGLLRLAAERTARSGEAGVARREQGILLGSGLVGGEGLVGVGIAALAFVRGRAPEGLGSEWAGAAAPWIALAAFATLALWFWRSVNRAPRSPQT
jgi:putative OPT family oligopeptide transporter